MADEKEIVIIETDRLFEFVDGLQTSGYRIDPRQFAVLNHLLVALIARGETLDDLPLKTMIAPLVCTTPLEQEDFYQRFERWYATLLPIKQSNNKEGIPPIPSPLDATAKEKTLLAEDSRTAAQKKAYIVREETKQETVSTKVRVKSYVHEILPVKQIKPIVSALRKRTQTPSTEVDVEGTIERAIKRNNWLEVVYRQRQTLPEYVVLIDRKNRLDQQARFVQEVLAKLAEDGVWLHQYEFKSDPRICFPLDKKNIPLRLKDLQARHPDSRLLIFSGTNELTNPLTGNLQEWIESLEYWSERAILTPDNLGKVLSEELESQDFAILPLTFDGLASVVRAFETDNVPLSFGASNLPDPLNERPTRWTGRNAPPETEVKALVNNLKKHYLDEKGFYWLCATAVYPELRWELTLHLGSVLKDDTDQPILDANRLIQIARLPWFRFGYMPDWLRLVLVENFSKQQEALVKQALIDLLSLVYKGKEFDLIFSQQSNTKRKNGIKKYLRTQKQTSSIEGPLQDQIFVKFILEHQRKKLSVTAPEYIQNALKTNLEQETSKNKLSPESTRVPSLPFEMLVDRREQVERFTEVLDRISRQGHVASNIFEWYGSPGIGKSTLVHMLARRAREREAVSTIIDFKQPIEKPESYLRDPVILVTGMVSDFKKQAAALDTREFDLAIQEYGTVSFPETGVVPAYAAMNSESRLYSPPDWLKKLKNVIIAFVKLIVALPALEKANGIRPVVVFFDETEHADIELVDWLEEWVIAQLVQIKHCVVVWMARRPWRWKRPVIKSHLTSEMLGVYSLEMVREQIQSGSNAPELVEGLFKNVYALTGGHPYANSIIINELDALAKQGEKLTPKKFSEFESKFLEEIFDRLINQYVLRELDSNDLKIACKFISLVRLFDSTMLRRILQACAGDLFASWKQEDFGDLMVRMKKTQLLVWEKGNAIDPSLRHIIQKYFMMLDRKTFINANRAALQVYEDWLARPVDNRGLFVLEELYHNAALMQVGVQTDLTEILKKRLDEYPSWIKNERALDTELERLEGEIINDKELEQYTPSHAELVKQVQAFREARAFELQKHKYGDTRVHAKTKIKSKSIFISYSHKNRKWLDRFALHLKVLADNYQLTVWDDTKIKSGAKWEKEIQKSLSTAEVALLLVTPDFLASEFINNIELPGIFKAAEKKGLTILWVAVQPSMYEETYISGFQSANDPSKPLSNLTAAKAEQEIIQICKKLKDVLK